MSTEKRDSSVPGNTVRLPGLFRAVGGVLHAAMFPKVDPGYKYQFPERRVLAEQNSAPAVQSVNQDLDKKGVGLEERHLPNFKRAEDIRLYPTQDLCDELRRRYKLMKNEGKTATAFRQEAREEQQKGAAADPKKVLFARAGALAHTMFGAALAATNPAFVIEDDLGIGTTAHHLDAQNECKQSATGPKA